MGEEVTRGSEGGLKERGEESTKKRDGTEAAI